MLVIEQQHIFQHLNLHAPDVCGCALRCHGTSRTSDFTVNHSNKKTNTFFKYLNLYVPDVCGCTLRCPGTFWTSDFTVNHSNKKNKHFF